MAVRKNAFVTYIWSRLDGISRVFQSTFTMGTHCGKRRPIELNSCIIIKICMLVVLFYKGDCKIMKQDTIQNEIFWAACFTIFDPLTAEFFRVESPKNSRREYVMKTHSDSICSSPQEKGGNILPQFE